MTSNEQTSSTSLRLLPGVVIAITLVLLCYVTPVILPELAIIGVLGGVVCGVAIAVWWLFFSRARWLDRIGAIVLMVAAIVATRFIVHESIAGGMMGLMLWIYSIPPLGLALVSGAVIARHLSAGARRAVMAVMVLLACGVFTIIRTDGVTGDGNSQLHWRWTPTAEQELLRARDERLIPRAAAVSSSASSPPAVDSANVSASAPATKAPSAPVAVHRTVDTSASSGSGATSAEWSGFRGRNRDGVIRGVRLDTDWSASPPVEIWRRPIGPGWSSFAVRGDLLYTQEQRGEEEIVACYRLSTGEPVWRHSDPVRFWESNGGAGPRGTPTLHEGRVYAFGATGILNALNGDTGEVIWSRNAASDTGVKVPDWGFASSPLAIDDLVIVAVSGQLAAYDARTGEPRWKGPAGGAGYSSPHLVIIDGVPQILLLRGSRTISVAPADGTVLWEHVWQPGVGIVQPALTAEGDVLVTTGDAMGGLGIRRVAVARNASGWRAEERWTTRGLKPYFNDFVVHEGHAYGFDGSILSAIDLEDGTRKWKGGRYGAGQMVLLSEQDLLLVLSEDGELALVQATPDRFSEIARVPALNAKTWNHPVVVGDVLLVRNGEEMAAFRLPATTTTAR